MDRFLSSGAIMEDVSVYALSGICQPGIQTES